MNCKKMLSVALSIFLINSCSGESSDSKTPSSQPKEGKSSIKVQKDDAEYEVVESFSLEPNAHKIVEVKATEKTHLAAFSDLTNEQVKSCATTGDRVKMNSCLSLEQENYDPQRVGKTGATRDVTGGAIVGATFLPFDEVIRLRVSNQSPHKTNIDLKKRVKG